MASEPFRREAGEHSIFRLASFLEERRRRFAFEALRSRLLTELQAGVTMLFIETGCAGREGKGVLCVIPPRKLFAAKELVYSVDPEAFLTITQVREVQGQGFSLERHTDVERIRQWEKKSGR